MYWWMFGLGKPKFVHGLQCVFIGWRREREYKILIKKKEVRMRLSTAFWDWSWLPRQSYWTTMANEQLPSFIQDFVLGRRRNWLCQVHCSFFRVEGESEVCSPLKCLKFPPSEVAFWYVGLKSLWENSSMGRGNPDVWNLGKTCHC